MNQIHNCRAIETLCRARALLDHERSWEWLGRAERWHNLGHREIAAHFQGSPITQSAGAPEQTNLKLESPKP